MNEPKPGEPWAYIGHKDNHWAGVCAANNSPDSLKEFLCDFASSGFSITTVFRRDEYNALLKGMKSWHEHPDYPDRKAKARSR